MELFYVLLILLFASRVCGVLAERFGQPSLVGELLAGIGLGLTLHLAAPDVLADLDLINDETFQTLIDLGIFFLMLLAGLELRPEEMRDASLRSTAVAVGGLALPLAAGFALGWWLLPDSGAKVAQALFLGTALAVTAVPVAARVLLDLGRLDSPVGRAIISAAVVDDVLSLVLLALLTALLETGEMPGVAGLLWLLAQTALFFLIVSLAGRFLVPRLGRMMRRISVEEAEISFVLVLGFAYAFLAEALGLHFIVGAFFAGLYIRRRTVTERDYEEIRKRIQGLTTGFLAPIFFASIGLKIAPEAVFEAPLFLLAVILLAFATKFLGAALPALATGFSRREALAIGAGMSGRGAVELIIADIALGANLFSVPEPPPPILASMFSTVVIMAIVTTLATPLLLRWIFAGEKKAGG